MHKCKFVFDERRKSKLEENSVVVLMLFFVLCPIEMLIKMVITRDYSSILGEFSIYISILFTFLIVHRYNRNYSPIIPRKNNGEEYDTAKTGKAKLKRMLSYAKESIIFIIGFSILMTAMDYLIKNQKITWNLEFFISQLAYILITFILIFICDYFYKEHKIKVYNRWEDKPDE